MKDNKYLQLNIIDILDMGFKLEIYEQADPYIVDKTHTRIQYNLEVLNSYISYDPESIDYPWYYVTTLGKVRNSIQLQIDTKQDLLNFIKILNNNPGKNTPTNTD